VTWDEAVAEQAARREHLATLADEELLAIVAKAGAPPSAPPLPPAPGLSEFRLAQVSPPPSETCSAFRVAETVSLPVDLPALLRRLEQAYVDAALLHSRDNKAAAAELLGLNRTTLVEKLRTRDRRESAAERVAEDPADARLTTRDVCDRLRVSRWTVWNWVRAGRLPWPDRRGRQARWRPEDIAAAEAQVLMYPYVPGPIAGAALPPATDMGADLGT